VRRSLFTINIAFTLLSACGSSVDVPPEGNPGSDTGTNVPASTKCEAKLSLEPAAKVIEGRAKLAFAVKVLTEDLGGATGDHPLKVVLKKAGTTLTTLHEGAEPLGSLMTSFKPASVVGLEPGVYEVEATLGCPATATESKPATVKTELYVARLGATRIDVLAGDGARVPLMYHAVNGVTGNSFPIAPTLAATSVEINDGESDLDDKDGQPRVFPEPWASLSSPPVDTMGAVMEEGASFPVSLKVGTKPDLKFTLGKTAKGAAGNVPAIPTGAPPIRLVLEGVAPTDNPVSGDPVTVRLTTSPVEAVNRYDVTLKWSFEAKGDDGWKAIPGATQEAKLRIYGVLGNDIGTAAPNLPWVAVVDAATAKIAGTTKEPAEVRKILVQYVYEEMALRYDRKSGASAYTTYPSGYVSARFDLTSFLKRSRGEIVNCTDCASILSSYANMIGAPLHYAIIGFSFSLNPIMGIGSTTYGSPFDSGRMAFNYHAVTTHDASKTINDATLALDGDSDPKVAPQAKLLVQNVAGADYLTRLSPGVPEYKYADQITTVR
jgi:hypothetical protein